MEGQFSLRIVNHRLTQGTEFIRSLSHPVEIDMEDGKVVIDVDNVKKICDAASDYSKADDWNEAVNMLLFLAGLGECPEPYLELSNICFTGPVGTPGGRGGLRKAGMALLTEAYYKYPGSTEVMCAYGRGLAEVCELSSSLASEFDACQAYHVLGQAASHNSVQATFEKGCMLKKLFAGCPEAAKEAKALVEEAASKDFPPALYDLGRAHMSPSSFPHVDFTLPEDVCDEHVRDLFQRAADAGNANAINILADMNAFGVHGAPRSLDKAVQGYADAIRKGCLISRVSLGRIYQTGMHGHAVGCKDVEKAKKCFWSGIYLHCSSSAFRLAQLMESEIDEDPMTAGMAEEMYSRTVCLGTDDNNQPLVKQAVLSLVMLLVAEYKIHPELSEKAEHNKKRLMEFFDTETKFQDYISKVEKYLLELSEDEDLPSSQLVDFLGPLHARRMWNRARGLLIEEGARIRDGQTGRYVTLRGHCITNPEFYHMFGSVAAEAKNNSPFFTIING